MLDLIIKCDDCHTYRQVGKITTKVISIVSEGTNIIIDLKEKTTTNRIVKFIDTALRTVPRARKHNRKSKKYSKKG